MKLITLALINFTKIGKIQLNITDSSTLPKRSLHYKAQGYTNARR